MRSFVLMSIGILLLTNSLFAQESKILITRTACVDIATLLNAVDQNPSMQKFLLNSETRYKEESLVLKKKIEELENYLLEDGNDLSTQEVEEIHNEIEYQKLLFNQIVLEETQSQNIDEIILKNIYRLIKRIAEQEGYSIIIEKSSAVIYSKPEVDITSRVIEMMSDDDEKTTEETE